MITRVPRRQLVKATGDSPLLTTDLLWQAGTSIGRKAGSRGARAGPGREGVPSLAKGPSLDSPSGTLTLTAGVPGPSLVGPIPWQGHRPETEAGAKGDHAEARGVW